MATIETLMNNLSAVDFNEVIEGSVAGTARELAQAQRDQMLHGKNAEGDLIGKYRNPAYARKKYEMNPLAGFGNVDLRLKNEFQQDIIVDARERAAVIDSANEKTEQLIKKYGKNIFGLNKDYAGEYAVTVMGPVATKEIIQQIHK